MISPPPPPRLTLHPHHHLLFLSPLSSPPKPLKSSLSATTTSSGLEFRRKILYLESLNVNSLKALSLNPSFRSTPLQTLISVEHYLLSMGLPRSSLGRIFDMHPSLLTVDPTADLLPIFAFLLNDVTLPFSDVSRAVIRCPRILVSSVETQLRPSLNFLRKLGFVGRRKIDCSTTVLLVSSVEHTLIPKLKFLVNLGFGEVEVANMVVRSPGLLTYSVEKNLKPKAEYFVKEMEGDLREIKRFPQYFSFSLDGRIKPRHRLLVEHGFEMPLWEMLKVSDGEFNVRLLEMRLRRIDRGRML